VALGVLVLDERLTPGMLVGFPLILAGSILGARRARVVTARRGEAVSPVPAASG